MIKGAAMKMSRVATAGVLALGLALLPTAAFAGPSKSADLSVSISSSPGSVKVGEVVTHTVTLANTGPNCASYSVATYDVDPPMTLLSVAASQGSCSGASPVSCSLGTVANGGRATVTVQVRPTAAGSYSSPSAVSAATADPSDGNNTATVTTTVDALERVETETAPPVLTRMVIYCPNGLISCSGSSVVRADMVVAAANGWGIDEGTLSFTDADGRGCTGLVYNGYANCLYTPHTIAVGGRASYSGSSTYAPSSSSS